MKIQILSRFNASVLFELEAEENTFKITLQAAVKASADLGGADLGGANLYGADLYGANLRGADLGGEILSKTPLQLNNLRWFVLISDSFLRIGCQRHSIEDWKKFSEEDIAKMDSSALAFLHKWKAPILALCDAHNKTEAVKAETKPQNAN